MNRISNNYGLLVQPEHNGGLQTIPLKPPVYSQTAAS